MKTFKLLCAALFLSWGSASFAQLLPTNQLFATDPTRSWQIIETDHFEVIYDKKNRKLALLFANEAERAAHFLEPILKIRVKSKVPLVVADITDSPNGEAMAMPRSQIEVYPVLPSVTDPTSEYYDWPRELVTHEYTHILNFEPTSGFMSVLRFLFGTIIRPGGYLPRWYTEGLAVEMESRFTPLGRGRSLFYSAFARAQVEDDALRKEGIDRINPTSIPTWPRGERPYTYGYFLMHELSLLPRASGSPDQTENIYYLLDTRYGGRIPWFLNGPVEDYFGLKFPELLDRTYTDLEKKVGDQLTALEATGATNGESLNVPGHFDFGAQVSPDGLKLAAIISQIDEYPSIRVWTRPSTQVPFDFSGPEPEPLVSVGGNSDVGFDVHQIAWTPDSEHLVFDHSGLWKHFNMYDDLYEIDINTKKQRRLTQGLRAREATVLQDGSLVFVVATSSRSVLMHSDRNGKHATLLYVPADGERVSTPRAFHGGVIYSHRDRHGREWIESLSLATKRVSILTRSRHLGEIHMMPVPAPNDPQGFYYAASYSGVMNIYYSDPTRTYAVTNVTTYATSPAVDAATGTLIYSRLTSNGFNLEQGKLIPMVPAPAHVETITAHDYPKAEETAAPPTQIISEHPYHSTAYLWPQYLLPFFYFVPGGMIFDLSSQVSDPLNHQQYLLDVGYDTRAGQPQEGVSYTNSMLGFNIDANVMNDYLYQVGANIVEHITYGSLDTRHFLFSNSNRFIFGPEFTYQETDYAPFLLTQMGPGLTFEYNNVIPPRDNEISPEAGENFLVGYDYFLSQLGNTSYPNLHGSASMYLSGKLLPRHHVVNLKLSAWVSPSQPTILSGTQQAGGEYFLSLLPPYYLVRGYTVGEFVAPEMYVGNFEYRFPLSEPYRGWGIAPLFFNRVHAALVTDAITFNSGASGGWYDATVSPSPRNPSQVGTFYVGSGAELRSDLQVFYGIPMTLRVGAYYGFTQAAYGGMQYFIGFGSVNN